MLEMFLTNLYSLLSINDIIIIHTVNRKKVYAYTCISTYMETEELLYFVVGDQVPIIHTWVNFKPGNYIQY